jgi:hypothetical protein
LALAEWLRARGIGTTSIQLPTAESSGDMPAIEMRHFERAIGEGRARW